MKFFRLIALLFVTTAALSQGPPNTTNAAHLPPNASVYDKSFAGKKTSSGQRYNPLKHTVASPVITLGTCLALLNTANQKVTTAVVNDHGPYIRGRELDLSRAVAIDLGIKDVGRVLFYPVPCVHDIRTT